MASTFLNRRLSHDNQPIIQAVLKKELIPYFEPRGEHVHLVKPTELDKAAGMTQMSFRQLVIYMDWTIEELEEAARAVKQ